MSRCCLVDAADAVAENLVELGVETYGDLRSATYTMYVDHCGVKPIDAGRLVAHFAQPKRVEKVVNAPRGVAQSVRARKRVVVATKLMDPFQGHDDDGDRDDSHEYDDQQRSKASCAVGGEERSA